MYHVFTATKRDAKHLPKDSNLVNFSIFTELYCKVPFRGFSVKYVVEGCEQYVINGKPYHIQAGNYLLANQFAEGYAVLESKQPVRGICIDLASEVMAEVMASHLRPDTPHADGELGQFFNTQNFLENQYSALGTAAGKTLTKLGTKLSMNPYAEHEFSTAFFYELAMGIIQDHVPIIGQLRNLDSVKSETKKELYRRVASGKIYIDECFTAPTTIADVAKHANMSEFHFFRVFKKLYGFSPHQYLMQRRMELAKHLLTKEGEFVANAAMAAGFMDISTFSKAFKKYYGVPPSSMRVG